MDALRILLTNVSFMRKFLNHIKIANMDTTLFIRHVQKPLKERAEILKLTLGCKTWLDFLKKAVEALEREKEAIKKAHTEFNEK